MKIKSLLVASACVLAMQAQSGFAKFYGKVDLGMALPLSFDKNPTEPKDSQGYGGKSPSASFIYGFGVGIEFSQNFRADLSLTTLNQFKFDKPVTTTTQEEYTTTTSETKSIYPAVEAKVRQNIGSTVTFASLYYDIGQFGNFVPYIGASLGVAVHDAQDYTAEYPKVDKGAYNGQAGDRVPGTDVPSDNVGVARDWYRGKRSSGLAFGIGIGAAYKVTENCALEIGYMYQDLGKAYTERGLTIVEPYTDSGSTIIQNIGDQANVATKIRAHNFKIGVRMSF